MRGGTAILYDIIIVSLLIVLILREVSRSYNTLNKEQTSESINVENIENLVLDTEIEEIETQEETSAGIEAFREIKEITIRHDYSWFEKENLINLVIQNEDGEVVYISPNMLRTLGYDDKTFNLDSFDELIHKEDLLIQTKHLEALRDNPERKFTLDKRIQNAIGEYICYEGQTVSAVLLDGKLEFRTIYTDVDRHYKIQESFKQAYELNEMLLNTLDIKIAVFDNEKNVIWLNKAMNEICGTYNYTVLFPEIYMRDGKIHAELKKVLYNEVSRVTFEHEIQTREGPKWCLIDIQMIDNNTKGIISYTDITEIKGLTEDLRTVEESNKNLIELLPSAVFLHTSKITYCNFGAVNLLGCKDDTEILGRNLLDFIQQEYKRKHVQTFMGKHTTPISSIREVMVDIDGKHIEVEVDRAKSVVGKEVIDIYLVRDITEKIKAEHYKETLEQTNKQLLQSQEYDKLRTEFFANISHELRTPINIIYGAIQLLEKLETNSIETKDGLDKYTLVIKQNCSRLLRLVNNLIDITKIDSGFYHLRPENYNIVNVVEEITLSVVEYVKAQGLEIIFDPEIEEAYVHCDVDSIERIVLNLLSNAIKFTPSGGSIYVTICEDGQDIVIKIQDTGIGIAEDKIELIFERFGQVDTTFVRRREGSGIGLSLVKSLLELQNGSVNVVSVEGEGSTFEFRLPYITEGIEEANSYDIEYNSLKVNMEFSDIMTAKREE
ncbi:MAG: hypothetical protein ATN36_03185 [Epulopiscium sp. Nele67-Bin005]|nr:MAG: hypothetical protein ATN36_03185 [Epulopiscium sp. Nele67-Bin005]